MLTFIVSTLAMAIAIGYTGFKVYWIQTHEKNWGHTIAHSLLDAVIALVTFIWYMGEQNKSFIFSLIVLFLVGWFIAKSANKLYWEY
jgi:hypothetical protein